MSHTINYPNFLSNLLINAYGGAQLMCNTWCCHPCGLRACRA